MLMFMTWSFSRFCFPRSGQDTLDCFLLSFLFLLFLYSCLISMLIFIRSSFIKLFILRQFPRFTYIQAWNHDTNHSNSISRLILPLVCLSSRFIKQVSAFACMLLCNLYLCGGQCCLSWRVSIGLNPPLPMTRNKERPKHLQKHQIIAEI